MGEIMKISEFIEKLNKIKEEHGDLVISIMALDADDSQGEAFVALEENDEGVAIGVTIIDQETALSFSEEDSDGE